MDLEIHCCLYILWIILFRLVQDILRRSCQNSTRNWQTTGKYLTRKNLRQTSSLPQDLRRSQMHGLNQNTHVLYRYVYITFCKIGKSPSCFCKGSDFKTHLSVSPVHTRSQKLKHIGSIFWLTLNRSSGERVVKLLACGARGPGLDSQPRHLNFEIGYLLLPSQDMTERSLNWR